MDYFWLVPAAMVAVLLMWIFYASITRERGAGERTDGRVLVDKPTPPRNETIFTDENYINLKRTDEPD